jgi:P-type conjugative transfer protein TrbJ
VSGRAACWVAAALIAVAAPARAQLTVYDPANHAENILQAARALETIQHQLESLQNEARNLLPLGLQSAGALSGDLARINTLLGSASRLAAEVGALREQFAREYAGQGGDRSGRGLSALADARWRNSVESLQRTLEVQAEVVRSVSATARQADLLAHASEGGAGALQAAQAGNQLLAVQARQLSDLTALLAAAGQSETLERARAAAERADATARLSRFLAGGAP